MSRQPHRRAVGRGNGGNNFSGYDLGDIQPARFPDLNPTPFDEEERNLSEEFKDRVSLMDTCPSKPIIIKEEKDTDKRSSCIYGNSNHGNPCGEGPVGELDPGAQNGTYQYRSISTDPDDLEVDDASLSYPQHGQLFSYSQGQPNIPSPSTTGSFRIQPTIQGQTCGGQVTVKGQAYQVQGQKPLYLGPNPQLGTSQPNSLPSQQMNHPGQHINVDSNHGTDTVHVAQQQGPPTGVSQPLVNSSFQIDENGECRLHLLSVVEHIETCYSNFQTLVSSGEVQRCINLTNKQHQTPLFLAVQQGNLPLVSLLLQHGADPNIQGSLYEVRDTLIWRNPLHLAVCLGDKGLPITEGLLSCPRVNVDALTIGDRLTPLHLALKCHRDRRDCLKTILCLLRKGANIQIREERTSRTVLMMALETRDLDLVRTLLKNLDTEQCRAMLQDRTRSGDTCLHVAAGLSRVSSRDKEMLLRLLVTKGANGNIQNNGKELPRDYAREEWNRMRTI